MQTEKRKAYKKEYDLKNKVRISAYKKEYRLKNKESISLKNKAYRLKNRESISVKNKIYRSKNKDSNNATRQIWRSKNRGKDILYSNKYRLKNKDKIIEYAKRYRNKNKAKAKIDNKNYYILNKDKEILRNNMYRKKRMKIDPLFKLSCDIRSRTGLAFKTVGYAKNSKTELILGLNYIGVMNHISSKFTEGMSFDNRSKWHIDHIIPLSSANNEEELIKLCHYTNLQPLWVIDNLEKGSKYNKQDKINYLKTFNNV
jgi:hypothetical protein